MKNIFQELVTKSGLILINKDSKVNSLDCDQAVFQKNLRSALVLCPKLQREETISRFVLDLEKYLDDERNLKPSLLFSQTSQNCSTFRGGQQDSLVRLLLNIDELQPKIVSFLTEKLLQLAYECDEDLKLDLCRLILANLRWLDHIVDSSSLNEKIIEILQGSPVQIQKEIICFLPNIIDDESHSEISKILCDLYKSTPELTSSILDALSYLTLDVTVLSDIHSVVLERLHIVKPENLSLVVKFLFNNTPSSKINKVVAKIREKIILPCPECSRPIGFSSGITLSKTKSRSKENSEDYELLLFSTIKTSSLLYKNLGTTWLKVVSDLSDRNSVKHFDFLVLLVLYQYIPSRRRGIESLMRNMVRLEIFTPPYIQSIFRNHSLIIKESFDAVKILCDLLIRSSEVEVSRFGSSLYRYAFASLGVFHQQEVILCLLSHLGDNECVRQSALSLLSVLAYNYPNMSNYVTYIKGSLDILETLSLREAKILIDLLLLLVNSNEAESSKDELSILIKKQLSHPDIKFKRLGVVGAVLTLKITMGTKDSGSEDSPDVETNLKESEALFNAVKESTTNYPCSSALFMDELATNILKNGLNQRLEKWISEKVIGDFEETFILDCETEAVGGNYICPVSFQWNLDDFTDSEQSKSIAVCIAKLVTEDLEHSGQEHSSRIVTLAPHFRLMRMVESHLYAGDLGNIDALLGCGVQMPTPETYKKFSSLPDKEQTFALTCLFYAINWFRELINAFATQKDKDLKKKVVLRLRKMLSLQGLLVKVLREKSSFQPPPATFDIDCEYKIEVPVTGETKGKVKENKKGKKRKLDDDKTSQSQTQKALITQSKSNLSIKETRNLNMKACKAFLRELHLDVFNLLFKKLCLDDELDQDNDSYLFVKEADFLISDLNEKFGRAFENESKKTCVLKNQAQKDIGFAHFDVFTAPEVAEQALIYIKPICAHLESICIFFQKINTEDEEESDEDLDKTSLQREEKTLPIINLYTSLFMSLRLFLTWHSLQLLEHSDLLKNCLKLFARKLELNRTEKMSTDELVSSSFNYLSKFCDSLVNMSTAVELVQLLDALITFSGSGILKEQLGKIIIKFLKRNWSTDYGNDTKGSLFSSNLKALLRIFFYCSADPINEAYLIANDGIKQMCEGTPTKNPKSKEYPTLKKNTLPIYYSVLSKNLVSGTKKMLLAKNSDNFEMLKLWSVSVKVLHMLTESLRKFESSNMFSSCLQHSKDYLDLFLQEGMPLFEKCLKKHKQEVTSLLKNLQLTTRFLHNLCTVVKCKKDSSAVRYVPFVKRSLETIIFRVKAMLILYNCQTAFWLGNLKNRDLQGNELLSQSQSSQDEDSNNEEVSDEGLSDVDVDDNVDGEPNKVDSYSIVY